MRTVERSTLSPNRPRDHQAVALWVEAALGSDPILIGGRRGVSIDVIADSIEEVDELAASNDLAREETAVALRDARDAIVQGLVATVLGDQSPEDLLDECLRVAGILEDSIGEVWEELLSFYDGGELVSHILGIAQEPIVGLFTDREGEIDELYAGFDRLIWAWQRSTM